MATPRVFVSSTCYDLKYIRENLKYFIKTLGYEPILSEDGDVYYNPSLHTHDACLSEVFSCQMMVLIIGGRYGGEFKESEKSITNHEYEAAIERKIPVFALVDSSVLNEHHVYNDNKQNQNVDENKISYPSTNDIRIFGFIDQVRKHLINNAIVPFKDFTDIESYLKKQWAGMMYEALTSDSEAKRVSVLFKSLQEATQNVQFMTKQLVKGTENKIIQLNVDFYDFMLKKEVTHDLTHWDIPVSPKDILIHETFDSIANNQIEIIDEDGSLLNYGGPPYKLTKDRYDRNVKLFAELKDYMLKKLKSSGIDMDNFLSELLSQENS